MRRKSLPAIDPDLLTVWRSCRVVNADPGALRWLAERRLDPTLVVAGDFARAVPGGQLMVPLYGEHGTLAALLAHDLVSGSDTLLNRDRDEVVVMANRMGLRVLAGTATKAPWPTAILASDLLAYLEWATALTATQDGPAVFGVLGHESADLIADRIPAGWRVLVRSPATWLHEVVSRLAGRCDVVVRAE